MTFQTGARIPPRMATVRPPSKVLPVVQSLFCAGWALLGFERAMHGHWIGCGLLLIAAGLWTPQMKAAMIAQMRARFYWTMAIAALLLSAMSLFWPDPAPAPPPVATSAGPTSMAPAEPAPTQGGQASPDIAAEVSTDSPQFVRLNEVGKAELEAILLDPGSAQYRNVGAYSAPEAKGGVTFCGEVNAKNGFGGYGGYERFIAAPPAGAWLQSSPGIQFRSVWRDLCRPDAFVAAGGF